MSVTEEQLAAFADGELHGEELEAVAAAVEADPVLADKVEKHRALRAALGAHFAPILDQEVPDRLAGMLQQDDNVVRLERPAEAKPVLRSLPRWGWVVGPALAATLAIAVFIPRGSEMPEGYAGSELAEVLDSQLVAEQGDSTATRIMLSFQREGGDYCRAFASAQVSGIACRDDTGWALVTEMGGQTTQGTEFQQAGNIQAELLAAAQEMAEGGALDAASERAAMEAGWQD